MDIITVIDHATGCHHCGRDLSGSPSDLFCGEPCQTTWQALHVDALPDLALPPRTGNPRADYLIALLARATAQSPEARSAADLRLDEVRADTEAVLTAITNALQPAITAIGEAFRSLGEALQPSFGSPHPTPPTDPREHALWLRQHRNTGPARQQRPPRAIHPRRSR